VSVYDTDSIKDISPVIGGDTLNDKVYKKYIRVLNDIDDPLWKEVGRMISKQSPDIVGISATSGQYGSALNIAKIVKEFDDIPVVMGGAHPTALPEETVKNEDVDIVVRGEGEYTFLDLVKKIESGEEIKDVLGITYKEKDTIINNPNRPFIQNLDDLPFPARHLILNKEDYLPEAFGSILASRGCPYKCIFCASKNWNRKIRYRSPENVVDEIKYLHENFIIHTLRFDDADFLINKRIVSRICDLLIEEGLIINWRCQTRADEISDELAGKMALAGCTMIEVGVESGNDETLKRIRKGITVEQIKESRRIFRDNFIVFCANFIIGFPWETKKDIEEMASFMDELDADFDHVYVLAFYPGTDLYDMYKNEVKDMDWRYYLIQRPEFCVNKNLTKDDFFQIVNYAEKKFKRKSVEKRLIQNLKVDRAYKLKIN
jgi:radical SAM superfamily enzyme YgiQ (UPF0313 family)